MIKMLDKIRKQLWHQVIHCRGKKTLMGWHRMTYCLWSLLNCLLQVCRLCRRRMLTTLNRLIRCPCKTFESIGGKVHFSLLLEHPLFHREDQWAQVARTGLETSLKIRAMSARPVWWTITIRGLWPISMFSSRDISIMVGRPLSVALTTASSSECGLSEKVEGVNAETYTRQLVSV